MAKPSRELFLVQFSFTQYSKLTKMVLAKSKNAVGLGNSLMNDRFGKGKGADRKKVSSGIHRTGPGGETVCLPSIPTARRS